MDKIVLFGGTFNPVTIEHVNIIKALVGDKSVSKVIVIPNFLPPHKKAYPISCSHRLNMLYLALKGVEKVEVSLYEINQKRAVYSYETIDYFKKEYPDKQLCFAMGTDMLYTFNEWKNPQKIVEQATIILFKRSSQQISDLAVKKFEETYNKKVLIQSYLSQDVSSTEIRIRKMLNLSLKGLATREVEEYIVKNNLYLGDRFYEYLVQVLPEKRRNHTAGVIISAIALAKRLGYDQKRAEIASLLHDNAKYLNYKDYKHFENNNAPKQVVHQFLGAFIARNQLLILDEDIITAIKYHTTGRANMTLLEKIVFIADIIEKNRDFNGVERLRTLVEKDFNEGFVASVEDLYNSLKEEKYYLTEQAYKFYVLGEK